MEYIEVRPKPGSERITINIEKDGLPYGQIWTWPDTKTEKHPWHVKLLTGEGHVLSTLTRIKQWVETDVFRDALRHKFPKGATT